MRDQQAAGGVNPLGQRPQIVQRAEEIRRLHHQRGGRVVHQRQQLLSRRLAPVVADDA